MSTHTTQTHKKTTHHNVTTYSTTSNPIPEQTDSVTPFASTPPKESTAAADKRAWQLANPPPSKYAPLAYGQTYPETSSGITPAMKTALYNGL